LWTAPGRRQKTCREPAGCEARDMPIWVEAYFHGLEDFGLKFIFSNEGVIWGAGAALLIGVLTYVIAVNTGSSQKNAFLAGFLVFVAGVAGALVVAAGTVALGPVILAAVVVAGLAAVAFFAGRGIATALGADPQTADAVGNAAAGAVAGAAVGAAAGAAVGGPAGAAVGAVVGAVVGAAAGFFGSIF
jgi:hypothetical protein